LIEPRVVFNDPSFADHVNVEIPDHGSTVERPLEVGGLTGNIRGYVQVNVSIKHTCRDDLRITLVTPSGTSYRLKEPGAGVCEDDLVETYVVHPSARVANGTWKLQVQDTVVVDVGYLDAWSLTFVGMAF
jgi:subtilisin-like proprotein convertase family protein